MRCPVCGTDIRENSDHCPICLSNFTGKQLNSDASFNPFLNLGVISIFIFLVLSITNIIYPRNSFFTFPESIIIISAIFIFSSSLYKLEKVYTNYGGGSQSLKYSSEIGASFIGYISLIVFGILFAIHSIIIFTSGSGNIFFAINSFTAYLSGLIFAIFEILSAIYIFGILKVGKEFNNLLLRICGFIFLLGGLIWGIFIWVSGTLFLPILNDEFTQLVFDIPYSNYFLISGLMMMFLSLLVMLIFHSRTYVRSLQS